MGFFDAHTSIESVQQKTPTTLPRVVIIGAGFGGLQAAKALGEAPVHLTVIDRDNFHLFQPMLYQVATAGLPADDISMSIRQILRKQKNTEVCLAEVTGIDVQGQKVLMEDKAIPFDYLIVATGATSNYFGHEHWSQFAPGLKSLDDGLKVRDKILLAFEAAEREPDPEKRQALLTFVLVGGGPTGVELAGTLADLAHKSLSGNFRHIRPSSTRIILVDGRVKVQSDLTIPGHANIFVIGDTAIVTQIGKHLPGVAPVAMQEAGYAVSCIREQIANKEHSRKPFHYHDKGTLATIGRGYAVVDIGIFRFTGLLAWFTWLLVHLFFLIGFRNRSRIILPEYISSPQVRATSKIS